MKINQFKEFNETIKTANEKDPVWYAGYLFLNLTDKQMKVTIESLKENPHCKLINTDLRKAIQTPSGLKIIID